MTAGMALCGIETSDSDVVARAAHLISTTTPRERWQTTLRVCAGMARPCAKADDEDCRAIVAIPSPGPPAARTHEADARGRGTRRTGR